MRYRFKGNIIVVPDETGSESSGSDEDFSEISYNELYGSLNSRRDADLSRDLSNRSFNSNVANFDSPNCGSAVSIIPLQPACSTPLRVEEPVALLDFEPLVGDDELLGFSSDEDFESLEVELYDGSDFSSKDFVRTFDEVANKHNFSGLARQDILKLFSNFLPSPNNIFAPVQKDLLPNTTTFNDGESSFIAIQLLPQLKKILTNNLSLIKKSWLSEQSWSFGKTVIQTSEIYLNMNIDGVALFKSRNFSVWPVWIEFFNLPEKIRGKFENHALLGIWKGKSKPNWAFFLKKVAIELEFFLNSTVFIAGLGLTAFKFLFLVCDMPAMASLCMVQQFNGYYGCPYCYIHGSHQFNRMIYSVDEEITERANSDYEQNAALKRFGVKDNSPLSKFFPIPWNVPVDPMHQVFLGAAKVLTAALISKIKSKLVFDRSLLKIMVPYDSLHKPKSVTELSFWKAGDYKLFFLHTGPLLFLDGYCTNKRLVESFMRLSVAVRLLSEKNLDDNVIYYAEKQLKEFFNQFTSVFGRESQSFNFHALRHLATQVKKFGPLWLYSAFSYEYANHLLLRTVSGSIKTPETIVEKFLVAQFTETKFYSKSSVNVDLYTKLSNEDLIFASKNNLTNFQSRYANNIVFTSEAYTYNKKNISNSFAQLSSQKFVKIEFFAKTVSSKHIAVVRFLRSKKLKSFFTDLDDILVYHYRIGLPGELKIIAVDELQWKCVLYEISEGIYLASVMREGFEHN